MSQTNGMTADALRYLDAHLADFTRELCDLSRIPSVSANGFPKEEVRRSAEATADALRRARVDNVRVLEIPGVHPYACGEWLKRPGAPTILLYGHHDVQPPGRPEKWLSPPFEPTERGGRLYGRGTADDKAGVAVHLAALRAHADRLPVGVTVLVEGEEEIGSPALPGFLSAFRDALRADVVVFADAGNWTADIPALTTSLRGGTSVVVEVRTLRHGVHSGMYGGPAPDALTALCRMLASLHDERGDVAVPGLTHSSAGFAGADPPSQSVHVSNGGQAILAWTAAATASSRATWPKR